MRSRMPWNIEHLEVRDLLNAASALQLLAPHVVGTDAGVPGTATLFNQDGTVRFKLVPYGQQFTGGVRVALADVNGDGVSDVVTAPGPGISLQVKTYSGVNGDELGRFFAFESSFIGGGNLTAGDFDRDGSDEIVVSADEGGGPRIRIVGGADGSRALVDFFAIEDANFRGGARIAAGDVDGDGIPELVVGAGVGGGSRVAVYEGAKILERTGAPAKLVNDFFAFGTDHRDGVNVAVGDVNGDGYADLIFGGGASTGPRVTAWDGRQLVQSGRPDGTPLLDTFAYGSGGVRVSAGDTNGDGRADIIVTSASPVSQPVLAYVGGDLGQTRTVDSPTDPSSSFISLESASPHSHGRSGNTPPLISHVVDQTTESGKSMSVTFTVSDRETAPPRLQVSASSANTSLVPAAGLSLSGSGGNRTLTITPADQTGTTIITVTVTDPGGMSATDTFTLTVSGSTVTSPPPVSPPPVSAPVSPPPVSPPPVSPPPVSPPPPQPPIVTGNNPPQISNVPNQAVPISGSTGTLPFTVFDAETPAANLVITAASSNAGFVPVSAVVLGGSGSDRTVNVTPTAGQTGTATITLTVTDGEGATSTETFVVYASDPITGIDSPTGRNPRLIWTREQQAVWQRMIEENHPWWVMTSKYAQATGTSNEKYGDFGQWATLAYQMTGDPAYAAKAWDKISTLWLGKLPYNGNATREYFAELVMMYDWLYPGLNSTQRSSFIDTLNLWADAVTINPTGWFGTHLGDSDETVGHYFGLALLDIATGPDNSRAGTYISGTWPENPGVVKPVGGLDATGQNTDTMRNTISWYIEMAKGGQWIESSEYNLGTLKLLLLGSRGVLTATGNDHFPEVTEYIKQAALGQLYELSNDLNASYQWGDTEKTRNLELNNRVTLLCMLAGLTQNDPQVGPYLNGLISELVQQYGATGYGSAEPTFRALYMYNPYAAKADWRSGLPASHYSEGTGILAFHAGWKPNDSFFGARMTTRNPVQHEVRYFGDFQLYRHGEWGITHPLGYGGQAYDGETVNSMVIAGLSSMWDRGPIVQASDQNGLWTYMVGETSGQYYPPSAYNPPSEFLHEWSRSIFYLPSSDGHSDTIITFDRVNADDPRTLPGFESYSSIDQAAINAAPALKQWVLHAPVAPTASSNSISWTTAGGQQVVVSTMEPENFTRTVYDEKVIWPSTANIDDSEKHYQVRISPTTDQQWDTLLNVVQVSDPGTELNNVGVQSLGGEASGVLVQRAGLADTLVMFGAQEATRVLSNGYDMTWTAGTSGTNVMLMDLDPSKNWSVSVNGGVASSLTVSSAGIGQFTATGTGVMTVRLIAG